jgi:hypothetical protein
VWFFCSNFGIIKRTGPMFSRLIMLAAYVSAKFSRLESQDAIS